MLVDCVRRWITASGIQAAEAHGSNNAAAANACLSRRGFILSAFNHSTKSIFPKIL